MATIENRSRFVVGVKNRTDLGRHFPFNKLAQATAYRDELRAAGLKPKLDQLDEHWLVRIRQNGYRPLQTTFATREEANAFVMKVEEERSRGLFIDYTKAHKTSLPVSALKVDRHVVQGLSSQQDGSDVEIDAISALSRSLHIPVIGEGVETTEELDALRAYGFDEVQGFLLARPMTPTSIEHLSRLNFGNV